MFWADVVKNNYKFCTCDGSWKYFKIVNTDVMGELLNFSLTPLDGSTCLIFSQRKGEHLPPIRDFCFNLKPFQHVKLEAYGGNVTLAGESHEGTESYKNNDRFAMNCPFGDEDDWKRRERTRAGRMPRSNEQIAGDVGNQSGEKIQKTNSDDEQKSN